MISDLICLRYLKNGKCDNSSCRLKHVKNVESMEMDVKSEKKSTTERKVEKKEDPKKKKFDTSSEGFEKVSEEKKKKCEFLLTRGHCKLGDKCYFSH